MRTKLVFALLFVTVPALAATLAPVGMDTTTGQQRISQSGTDTMSFTPGSVGAQTTLGNLGGEGSRIVNKSANFTITSADAGTVFNVTTGSSALVATFPTASTLPSGWVVYIRKADSGTGTIANDAATWLISSSGHTEKVQSDGSTYAINRAFYGSFNSSGDLGISNGANHSINLTTSGTGATTVIHLAGASGVPTVAAGTGAGTGSPTVSVTGTDLGGIITVNTGTILTPSANATVVTLTFNSAGAAAPQSVTLTPANSSVAALSGSGSCYASGVTSTAFNITSGSTALLGASTYKFYYLVVW